ncbi:MAG: NAD(P)-dependent alcohol dehydrogenase [Candidatus Aminicenantes bacterium]|nr:MAG: NAD(P)-dependent alcohol dehydrogenase [Candidatus Aminicenantes bacterium]
MKAIVYTKYGPPDVLQLKEIEKPTPRDNEVLVNVHAVGVNASDWEMLRGKPLYGRFMGLFKPGKKILGSDIAGRVETVGKNVKQFKPGDDVFGDIFGHMGGFAEYVCAPENTLLQKPAGMTFEEAAVLPQAAVIALQGIRDKGQVQPGQKVLINGAGGGAGTFAVQLAKHFGAEVTGVDSTGKLDMLRSIGADHVIDYTREDFTKKGQHYDLILDMVAYRSIFAYKRALSAKGKYYLVGGSMAALFQTLLLGPWIKMAAGKKLSLLGVRANTKDLAFMTELFEAGKVVPVIDKHYPLSKVAEALLYLGQGHAKGKIVITVKHNNKT